MKAGILFDDRSIRLGHAPDPVLGPGEVLVQPAYAGLCGTDLHIFRGEFRSRVKFPAILGHEFGGTIVELGKDVGELKVGDRVAVDPIVSCHRCASCLVGQINACRTLKLLGVDLDGGFGQLINVPVGHVFALPDNVPLHQVPLVEVYSLGHHILRRGRVQPGETVAILGAGKLGLSVLDVLCHSAGAAVTLICDVQPFRLRTARAIGADYTIDATSEDPVDRILDLTQGVGVDCVIECIGHHHPVSGQEAPLAQAVKMIRNGGRIVTAGLGEQPAAVHFKTLVIKEGEIIASRVTLGEFPRAIRLLGKGLLHPDSLITHTMPLNEIARAFDQLDREEPSTIKIVVDVQAA
ncbi:MAG: alcohol dehydrogenase catalytic domain-containing protein [Polyangiaceae bacterium]|jgi:2-desacetyl-2-hydroxyethyl bacteriochlorophyllide A dehydrogenase